MSGRKGAERGGPIPRIESMTVSRDPPRSGWGIARPNALLRRYSLSCQRIGGRGEEGRYGAGARPDGPATPSSETTPPPSPPPQLPAAAAPSPTAAQTLPRSRSFPLPAGGRVSPDPQPSSTRLLLAGGKASRPGGGGELYQTQ